jgi:hypothetical protein
MSRGNQRDKDRERAAARNAGSGKKADDGLTPAQRNERCVLSGRSAACVRLDLLKTRVQCCGERTCMQASCSTGWDLSGHLEMFYLAGRRSTL